MGSYRSCGYQIDACVGWFCAIASGWMRRGIHRYCTTLTGQDEMVRSVPQCDGLSLVHEGYEVL